MNRIRIVIAGIGGFGREVIDIIDACNAIEPRKYELLGALDDDPQPADLERLAARRVDYLGTTVEWCARPNSANYVIGISSPKPRRAIDERFADAGLEATTLRHPSATVGGVCDVGPGTILCAGSRLTTNISTGRHVHVHVNSTIGHDAVLRAYSSIFPQSAVSGHCVIGTGATVGASATVLQGRDVGNDGFVGAGAVVTKNVPQGVIVKGVPAR